MKKIIVNNNCVKGHTCPVVNICPSNAITHNNINELPKVNNDKCTLCGKCLKIWCKTFELKTI